MPDFVSNRPAPEYTSSLKRLLTQIAATHPFNEDVLWNTLYRLLYNSHRGPTRLLGGEFAEFLPHVDTDALKWVVAMYDDAFVDERYAHIGDFKHGTTKDMEECPITKQKIKPVQVSLSVIDAVETVWEKYYGKENRLFPHYHHMMAHILNWTLQLEWAGFAGFTNFERKWQQVKEWPDSGIMGILVMREFLHPRNFRREYESTDIKHYMPVEMKRRLYMEALEQYNTRRDPAYFGDYNPAERHYHRICSHYLLAKQIIEEEKDLFDDDFKAVFMPYYKAVPPYEKDEDK